MTLATNLIRGVFGVLIVFYLGYRYGARWEHIKAETHRERARLIDDRDLRELNRYRKYLDLDPVETLPEEGFKR